MRRTLTTILSLFFLVGCSNSTGNKDTGTEDSASRSDAESDLSIMPDVQADNGQLDLDEDTTPGGPCVPDCVSKVCGDDGCGGNCGTCDPGTECQEGLCACIQSCDEKQCGKDGCGGSCGECQDTETCDNFACVCDFLQCDGTCCAEDEICHEDACCLPDCNGKNCGTDGCGGSCGECPEGQNCNGSQCECSFESCAEDCCDEGDVCNEDSCCTPDCEGKECGSDGCGGFCGECPDQAECIEGECTCYILPCGEGCCGTDEICYLDQCCAVSCDGKVCGDDWCGGSCGDCAELPGTFCNVNGQCECQPSCPIDDCAAQDGCGGFCGTACLQVILDPVVEAIPVGEPVTITGIVTEDGQPATVLDLVWESDIDGDLGAGTGPDAAGVVSITTATLSTGTHTITLTATNTAQNQGVAETIVAICEVSVAEDFSQDIQGGPWKLYGDAWWNPGGWIDTTDLEVSNKGAACNIEHLLTAGDITISFSFATGPEGYSGAAGMALSIWNVADVPELDDLMEITQGGAGLGYGVSGPSGDWIGEALHVEVDTRVTNWGADGKDPSGEDHIAIHLDGNPADDKLYASVSEIEDMAWRDVTVTLSGEHVTVKLDGDEVINGNIPGWSLKGGYLCLSGGTGVSYNYHRFDDILVGSECTPPEIPDPTPDIWLLSVDNTSHTLQLVDTATGKTTDLCQLPHTDSYPSLTFNRQNLLFGSRVGNSLDVINPCTCEVTEIGDYGDFGEVFGITSDSGEELMGLATTQDVLMGIDTITGQGTTIGDLGIDFFTTGATWSDVLEGLYAINGTDDKLYLVDPATGAATNPVNLSYDFNNVGIELHPKNGIIYACSTQGDLLTVDPDSGKVTVIGDMGQTGACTNLAAPWSKVPCIDL